MPQTADELLEDLNSLEPPASLASAMGKLWEFFAEKGYHLADILAGIASFLRQEFEDDQDASQETSKAVACLLECAARVAEISGKELP